MDLSCRVCFQEEEIMVDIFEEVENFQSNLCLLLEKCGGLEVKQEDMYSHYLCKECTSDLLVAAKFREKCERAREILQNLTEDVVISREKDEEGFQNDMKTQENTEDFVANNEILSEFLLLRGNGEKQSEVLENPCENAVEDIHQIEMAEESSGVREDLVEGNLDFVASQTLEDLFEIESQPIEVVNHMDMEQPLVAFEAEENFDFIPNDIENLDDVEVPNEDIDENKLESSSLNTNITLYVDEKNFKCDMCGAAFKNAINLKKHMETLHMLENLFCCEICDHCFSTEERCQSHLESCKTQQKGKSPIKKEVPRSDNTCTYCGKQNATLFALNMHLRTHTGERPYQCSQCEKAFKTQSALQTHMKRHFSSPDLTCPTCGKSFYEINNLKAHLNIHTGNRPHVCTICNKSFSRVFLLRNHVRIHTGEKPYQCQYCEKSFIQNSDRRSHELTHTGDKPYKCQVCSKGFTRRSLLNSHINKHGHNPTETMLGFEELIEESCQESEDIVGYEMDEQIATINYSPEQFEVI